MLDVRRIGLMCQPGSNHPKPGWLWAADNGCFSPERWKAERWGEWLIARPSRSGCLFATVPDVVADAEATLARFWEFRRVVVEAGYPVAFVAQDGLDLGAVPWERIDCLFIGGSTSWKCSEEAFGAAAEARLRGKWVHVGRVNGGGRYQAWAPFADSCDGTFLAFGPKANVPRLTRWLEDLEREPSLWGDRGA